MVLIYLKKIRPLNTNCLHTYDMSLRVYSYALYLKLKYFYFILYILENQNSNKSAVCIFNNYVFP